MSHASQFDPITIEVIKGSMRAFQREMSALIERTAMSDSIREKLDFFTALFDKRGALVTSVEIPLGANMTECVIERYPLADMKQGDLFWYNDCYGSRGAVSHSPDVVVLCPIFHGEEIVGFSGAWGHMLDVGGLAPGSNSPRATEVFHDGIIMPPSRLERAGVRNEELFAVFARNSRFPDALQGDLRALIAAVRLGEARTMSLCDRFGATEVMAAYDEIMRQSARAVRTFVQNAIPDGSYEFEDWVDGDIYRERSFAVRLRMDKRGDDISMDFSKSDDQSRGTINFIMNECVPKQMLGMYVYSKDPTLLVNDGCLGAVGKVTVREGSILRPKFPAALGQRAVTWLRVNSCVLGAIGKATQGNVPAASPYFVIVSFRWRDDSPGGTGFAFDGLALGHGGRPFADGHDAIYFVGQRDVPVEYTELEYPLRVETYAMHVDSGGPGLHRGGCGVVRDYRVLRDGIQARHTMDNVLHPPYGVRGGQPGRPGRFVLNPDTPDERALDSKGDGLVLKKNDVLRVITCGGGGWGEPFGRDPEKVLIDVMAGMVSREAAADDYGVVITEKHQIDVAATERRRKSRAA